MERCLDYKELIFFNYPMRFFRPGSAVIYQASIVSFREKLESRRHVTVYVFVQ